MNKWYIKIYLDSGAEIQGIYKSNIVNSTEVCEKLFTGANTISGITSMTGGNLLFNTSKVSAFEIDAKEID